MNAELWNILLVEDDEDDYLLMSELLSKVQQRGQQLNLVWAHSYQEGLARACLPELDIALVDYDLGEQDGITLIRTAVEAGSGLAFVLCTGQGNYQIDMQAMQAGADDYLNKAELSATLLERSIRYALSHKRGAVSLAAANDSLARANALLANANEALALANARLQASEERFQLSSRAVVGMVYDYDMETGQAYRSEGIQELIGLTNRELGENREAWQMRVHPDDARIVVPKVHEIFEGSAERYELEYRVRHADGRWIHVIDRGYIQRRDGQAVRAVGTTQDISRQKQLEAELRRSEERFRIALSNAPVTVATIDRDLNYTWIYNPRLTDDAESLDQQAAIIGQGDEAFLPPESVDVLTAIKRGVLEREEGFSQEVTLNTYQGKRTFILVLEPLRDPQGEVSGMTAAALDITEQRDLERRQLRSAMQMEAQRHLLDQREMERQQIARDLHDGPIQEVVGLMFAVQEARAGNPQPELDELLAGLYDSLQNLSANLRGVCNELRPPLLMRFGLARAIRAHAEDYTERNPETKFVLELAEDLPTLSDTVRLTIYRIFQEALNNIARHAHATRVTVRLWVLRGQLLLEVQDNGQGFRAPSDWVELARAGHLGLVGMRERVEAISGRLELFTRPGKGTRIRVSAPLT